MELFLAYAVFMLPLMLMAAMGIFVALPGLVWSPFAAAITWRIAQKQGLSGGRYALAGAASSIFLLLHWPLLLVTLLSGQVPVRMARLCYVLLYSTWLLGPIVFWGQFIAQLEYVMTMGIGGGLSEDQEPPVPVLAYGGFALMIAMWVASARMTWRMWESIRGAAIEDAVGFRYMMPFALAWACTACTLGYYWLGPK